MIDPSNAPERSLTRTALLLTFIVASVLTGCKGVNLTPSATGPDDQIFVITDSASWNGVIGDALRSELGAFVQTLPTPETAFDLIHRPLTTQRQLRDLQKRKNLVFVAALEDSTAESSFLQSAFSPEALAAIKSGGAVVSRDDVWRRFQKVYYVAAETPAEVARTIESNGPDMLDALNNITRQRVEIDMFKKGRQFDKEERLLEKHDFKVKVQHDYHFAVDTTDFVWLRRIVGSETWRSLFVYYIEGGDPSHISADWVLAQRDSLSRLYLQGNMGGWVEVDRRRPMEFQTIDFLGRYGFEFRGLWQMVGPDDTGKKVQYGGGGPFLSYTFYDEDSGRLYMIDGMVFAPGYGKRDFLRQMEVIAHT
ncbi:MAG: DUF4837 family protein, partial [Rhodothermales bacterium]|nr:DUF4837 family protein [Rhodothermales bacterium]